jgi:plastocyanin
MFGFKDIRSIQGVVAGIIEIAAFLVLGWLATTQVRRPSARAAFLGAVALIFAILLTVGELTASTTSSSTTTPTVPSGASEITVIIKNFAFQPADPKVTPGEKILVKNEDGVAHTFSSMPGAAAATAFTTGAISPDGGQRVLVAPTKAGTYPFECLIHTFMKGTLTVS